MGDEDSKALAKLRRDHSTLLAREDGHLDPVPSVVACYVDLGGYTEDLWLVQQARPN